MNNKINWKKISKILVMVCFILGLIFLFLAPVINMTYTNIPLNQRWGVPTGEYIYSWGILLQVLEGNIINITLATNLMNFPVEVIPLIVIGSFIIMIGLLLNSIEKISKKTKGIFLLLLPILGGIIGLYAMVRITVFGFIIKQSAQYFKFDAGLYSGYFTFLLSLILGIIIWINSKNIKEELEDEEEEEFFDIGLYGSSTD